VTVGATDDAVAKEATVKKVAADKATTDKMLAVIKCIYLPPTYLHFIQDIEVRCLLQMRSMSFVDLPF
jgi:hypothetical protein